MVTAVLVPLAVMLGSPSPPAPPVAASESEVRVLGDEPVQVAFEVPSEAFADEERGRLRIVIEELVLLRPGAYYHVYLNLPEGQEPDPESRYFVGNIALFGEVRADDPGGDRSFDVTDQIAWLRDRGEWAGRAELTFLRGNPQPPSAEVAHEGFVRFRRVVLIRR